MKNKRDKVQKINSKLCTIKIGETNYFAEVKQ